MSSLTIYKENFHSATTISNIFIDEFLASANDCEIKVYLYLVRMLSANLDISIYDMVEKFNHTEADIMHSLRYWERKGVLVLDFDENNVICAIHMMDLSKYAAAPVAAVSAPAVPAKKAKAEAIPSNIVRLPEKPKYTAEDLKAFKSRREITELLFVAGSYFGRPLDTNEITTLLYISDTLHFSKDLIDYLIQYCVDCGKKDIRYIEKVALNWAEHNVSTPEQAAMLATKYDKNVYTVMNHLGRNTSPTDVEMAYILKWSRDYAFPMDIILEACDRTALKSSSNRFEYADAILSNWKKENISNLDDIKKMDELHKAEAARSKKPAKAVLAPGGYNFDELEKQLLSN